jgi:2-alkyl-3-oxoalkanoate reductase
VKIFVTGATGVVGRRVLPMLIDAEHAVAALSRSTANAAALEAVGARPVTVSLFDAAALARALRGQDAVINLATHMPSSSLRALLPGAWSENDRIRTAGSAAVADAAIASGVRRLIQESFAPVYPDCGDRWIDETTPIAPARYNRTVACAESAAEAFTRGGRDGVVLRFGVFYGPDSAQIKELIGFIAKGWAPLPSDPTAFISPLSHDDAAAAVVAALNVPAGVYNVVDDEPMRRQDYFGTLAEALNVATPKIPPRWMAYLLGSVGPLLARSQRISNRKLRAATTWRPTHPSMREGWPATIRQMQERAAPFGNALAATKTMR